MQANSESSEQRVSGERCVLVVGGTGGIGGAIAQAFRQLGERVIVTGATVAEVDTFAAAAAETSAAEIAAHPLDVTNSEEVEHLVRSLDRLDVLVNCAGLILRDGAEHEPAGFDQVVAVNLSGTMRMCAASRELLRKTSGCVVNIASMLSYFGSGFVPGYSASKGGIVQLTKSLAIAWAEDSIRVNAIAPGWIRTSFTAALQEDDTRSQAILDRTPMARWGVPEDVAGAAVFLCSPPAAFITGVVLPVDGGYSIA